MKHLAGADWRWDQRRSYEDQREGRDTDSYDNCIVAECATETKSIMQEGVQDQAIELFGLVLIRRASLPGGFLRPSTWRRP